MEMITSMYQSQLQMQSEISDLRSLLSTLVVAQGTDQSKS